MKYNDRLFIGVGYTSDDYLKLNLGEDSPRNDWEQAINIFKDRIEGRYLNIIRLLLQQDINESGFSIMALNCLLIETFHQYVVGEDETGSSLQWQDRNGRTRRPINWQTYCTFLRQAFPRAFNDSYAAKAFYRQIRCGILHSAQTKGLSSLTCDAPYIIQLSNDKADVYVDVVNFTNELMTFYDSYCRHLVFMDNHKLNADLEHYSQCYYKKYIQKKPANLRLAFIRKMNYICRDLVNL